MRHTRKHANVLALRLAAEAAAQKEAEEWYLNTFGINWQEAVTHNTNNTPDHKEEYAHEREDPTNNMLDQKPGLHPHAQKEDEQAE
jgi:hypothetical protein